MIINHLAKNSNISFGTSGIRGLSKNMTFTVCHAYVTAFLMYLEEIGEINKDNSVTDELYNVAIEIIISERKASTSFLQRKLQIGYNRAARIIDQMEANGEVSKANHVGKREVLK